MSMYGFNESAITASNAPIGTASPRARNVLFKYGLKYGKTTDKE